MTAGSYVAEGFDGIDARLWEKLQGRSDSDVVFLTKIWQQSWWETFGRGRLLLVVGIEGAEPVAIAPLFADQGMVFFVGSGGSDYLDLIGSTENPRVLDAMLDTARRATPGFLGFRFYHVPDASQTAERLAESSARLNLTCFNEGSLPAPILEIHSPVDVETAVRKKSLTRHERSFAREGRLNVSHFRRSEEIRPHLNEFFAQHIERWSSTDAPSLFNDLSQREFFERVTDRADESGWLRFTRVEWQGSPIAFHWGMSYQGRYLWYKPTFAVAHARRSPGEVLLRSLLLAAGDECATVFDFGLGDEAFKHRFASKVETVTTWGLYPNHVPGPIRNP